MFNVMIRDYLLNSSSSLQQSVLDNMLAYTRSVPAYTNNKLFFANICTAQLPFPSQLSTSTYSQIATLE